MEDELPKETLLKPKARKTPVKQTEEDRAIIAMRMREINDKKIMDTAEKIRKQQSPKEAVKPPPPPPPVEEVKEEIVAPKIIRQKKFIKVIEITDDEETDDEPPIIIKKKPKVKPLEETGGLHPPCPLPVKKTRVTKPKEPKEPPKPIYEIPPMPRGRFL